MASNAGGDQHTAALLAALNTTGTSPEIPVPAAKVSLLWLVLAGLAGGLTLATFFLLYLSFLSFPLAQEKPAIATMVSAPVGPTVTAIPDNVQSLIDQQVNAELQRMGFQQINHQAQVR